MKTVELTFSVDEAHQDALIGLLDELGFETYLQSSDELRAYMPVVRWGESLHDELNERLQNGTLGELVDVSVLEERNWNEEWEASIEPIHVAPFLLRPSWKETPDEYSDCIEIVVDPKSSFGTGYHESTRLMLRMLSNCIEGDEYVLDAGTGTGILAIAAIKLGAREAVTFDIERTAVENATENFNINGVADRVSFRLGTLDKVPETGFDVILANINKRVLLDYLPTFKKKLTGGGCILMAGLLKENASEMRQAARQLDLRVTAEATENEWWAVQLAHQADD